MTSAHPKPMPRPMTRPRRPAGSQDSKGGQFAPYAHTAPSIDLPPEKDDLPMTVAVSRQTEAPIKHRSMHASNRQAREVARLASGGEMDLNPPYQRPSVWTQDQRINLVRSWLSGVPVPAVIINTRGGNPAWEVGPKRRVPGGHYYAVVDGKQRIETAVAWFEGDLAVPASWFDPEVVETTVETDDGPYVTYTGLTVVGQRHMSNGAMLPVIEAAASSIEEEADLFLLVNTGGTAQSGDDLANAAAHASGNGPCSRCHGAFGWTGAHGVWEPCPDCDPAPTAIMPPKSAQDWAPIGDPDGYVADRDYEFGRRLE